MKKLLLLLIFLSLLFPSIALSGLKPPGVLEEEDVVTDERLGRYKVVGVRLFSTDEVEYENVDGSELKRLLKRLPDYQKLLARTIRRGLKDFGFDALIIENGKDADKADMILEGKITSVDLGNAATRVVFFVTGNIGLSVEGRLVDAKTGNELAKFSHESSSGLDESFDKWQMLSREVGEMGEDIAEFTGRMR